MAYALDVVHKFDKSVTEVVFPKKGIEVEVIASDGKNGRGKHVRCAMAQACCRQLGIDKTIVSRSRAYLIKDKVASVYQLSKAIREEILAYDRSGIFSPGTYRLQPCLRVKPSGPTRGKATGKYARQRKTILGLRKTLASA